MNNIFTVCENSNSNFLRGMVACVFIENLMFCQILIFFRVGHWDKITPTAAACYFSLANLVSSWTLFLPVVYTVFFFREKNYKNPCHWYQLYLYIIWNYNLSHKEDDSVLLLHGYLANLFCTTDTLSKACQHWVLFKHGSLPNFLSEE